MLRGNSQIDKITEVPQRLGLRGGFGFLRGYWKRYDLALITQPGDRAHLMGWVASRCRSGLLPESGSSNWWKQRLLNQAVRIAGDRGDTHVVTEKLALLRPWLDLDTAPTSLVLPSAAKLPDDVATQLKPDFVVVHTPSMWTYKQWPLPHYRHLIAGLLSNNYQVVLSGGPGQHDRECVQVMLDLGQSPALLDACGALDFNQLVTLLKAASLYIGPDTSVSHLAAAAGVSTLAIFGPTNPRRWAPWPAGVEARTLFERSSSAQTVGNVTVMQGNQACVPCGHAGCEDHRSSQSDCLTKGIEPEKVLEQALHLLRKS